MLRPILLLHGFASSPRVMAPLAHRLERTLSRRVICVRTSAGADDLRDSAKDVDRIIEELSGVPGFQSVDVVGHSMGGLIASHLLKRIDRGNRVRRVVTLGSPHRGSPLASAASLLMAGMSPAMRAMRPGSRFLSSLEWAPVPLGSEIVSIASTTDRLVPAAHAALPETPRHRNIVLDDVSHLRLIFCRRTFASIAMALAEENEQEDCGRDVAAGRIRSDSDAGRACPMDVSAA